MERMQAEKSRSNIWRSITFLLPLHYDFGIFKNSFLTNRKEALPQECRRLHYADFVFMVNMKSNIEELFFRPPVRDA